MPIHEQEYVTYDGPLERSGAWWVFARTQFRLSLSFLRTKLLLLVLWIPVIVVLIGVLIEFALQGNIPMGEDGTTPGASATAWILQLQFFSVAILYMASGCGAVSDDLRHQTFQLFFSRPVERWEYTLGKFLGLFMLGSLVTLLPATLIGGLRLAYYAQTDLFKDIATQTATALSLSLVLTSLAAAIVLGLSSITKKTGYAVLSWIGVLLVPLILSTIVRITTEQPDMANLWSLNGNLMLIATSLMGAEAIEVPAWAPWLLLLTAGGAGIAGLVWRVNKLEGVA
jgi:ABC-type transport system involved in multi-copper enzyme maturation permease subunit